MIWYNMTWYDTIWYDMIWYDIAKHKYTPQSLETKNRKWDQFHRDKLLPQSLHRGSHPDALQARQGTSVAMGSPPDIWRLLELHQVTTWPVVEWLWSQWPWQIHQDFSVEPWWNHHVDCCLRRVVINWPQPGGSGGPEHQRSISSIFGDRWTNLWCG